MGSRREELELALTGQGVLGKAGDGEIIFPLRSQDACAPLAIIRWCELVLMSGGSKHKVAKGLRECADMLEQQERMGCKVPD